ncbi:MAG: hypothetical protein ACUVV3_07360 [Dehalococcoidia bacterium]
MRIGEKPRKAKVKKARAPRARTSQRHTECTDGAKTSDRQDERGFLFEDPYWDDAFCSYYDPTMGTCCPNRGK